MERPDFHFRQAQSAYDLIAIVRSVGDERLLQIGHQRLQAVVEHSACRFVQDIDQAAYEAVASAALEATEHAAIAVAILIANELQEGLWTGEVDEFAWVASERILIAEPRIRSAILRGLDTLESFAYHHEPKERLMPSVSRLTKPLSYVLPSLIALAKSMDLHTQKIVSTADYYDADKHLEALQKVLASDDCRLPTDDNWYPSEVVELVAHVRDTIGFTECTALLLVNALTTNDEIGWFQFRWGELAAEYNSLPTQSRNAILTGLRYLYEADDEFLRYEKTFRIKKVKHSYDPLLAPLGMIQFTD